MQIFKKKRIRRKCEMGIGCLVPEKYTHWPSLGLWLSSTNLLQKWLPVPFVTYCNLTEEVLVEYLPIIAFTNGLRRMVQLVRENGCNTEWPRGYMAPKHQNSASLNILYSSTDKQTFQRSTYFTELNFNTIQQFLKTNSPSTYEFSIPPAGWRYDLKKNAICIFIFLCIYIKVALVYSCRNVFQIFSRTSSSLLVVISNT